ncbi:SIR2 family protein [Tenacibaculum dicentrarchi]|nr:SIR2 family protein [Tenacibaculum dicentrarchi]
MKEYIDISASLHTKSLTLFVGTGFSKYMTNGVAPSWLELMAEITKRIDKKSVLLNQLFNIDKDGVAKDTVYDLTIIAQILEAEYKRNKKNIKKEVANIISETVNEKTIDIAKLENLQFFFEKYPAINIITTNYDTIFSDYLLPNSSRVFVEGGPIPRLNSHQNIFHIHGCITKPNSIVLTLNDYFNFQNSKNYFARKFFTLLQETTVCVIGYSLGDFNLNTILSEVNNNKTNSFRKSDLYYISRTPIPEIISSFYSFTYGIKTLENTEVNEFFENIEETYPKARKILESITDLHSVLDGSKIYTDDFLKLRLSLSKILLQASNIGIENNNEDFLKLILKLLKKKQEFSTKNNAWLQYEHLADWLIEVASCMTIRGSIIEDDFSTLVKYSLRKASKRKWKGYSWYAWKEWRYRWNEMKLENQIMIKDLIENNTWDSDLEIERIIE